MRSVERVKLVRLPFQFCLVGKELLRRAVVPSFYLRSVVCSPGRFVLIVSYCKSAKL